MNKAVVIGGGISGLIAGEALRSKGISVTILEPSSLGRNFLSGSTKCVRKTHEMISFLNGLDIPWSDHTIRTGMLLRGSVHRYPDCMDSIKDINFSQIHAHHYRKTRKISIPSFGAKVINDPGSAKGDKRALRFDPMMLVHALALRSTVERVTATRIVENRVLTSDGRTFEFDVCVAAVPLWGFAQLVDWFVPDGVAMSLNVLRVLPRSDPYVRWDSIYTPYTPGDMIHRINVYETFWDCEYNGDFESGYSRALDDIGSLFPAGFQLRQAFSRLKGHLLPLPDAPVWPANIVPLGRYARWDARITADETLDSANKVAEKWR